MGSLLALYSSGFACSFKPVTVIYVIPCFVIVADRPTYAYWHQFYGHLLRVTISGTIRSLVMNTGASLLQAKLPQLRVVANHIFHSGLDQDIPETNAYLDIEALPGNTTLFIKTHSEVDRLQSLENTASPARNMTSDCIKQNLASNFFIP